MFFLYVFIHLILHCIKHTTGTTHTTDFLIKTPASQDQLCIAETGWLVGQQIDSAHVQKET